MRKLINAALVLFILLAASMVSKAHAGLIHKDFSTGHFSTTGHMVSLLDLPSTGYWHQALYGLWDVATYVPEQAASTNNITPALKTTNVSNPSTIALLGLMLMTLATQSLKRQHRHKAVIKVNCSARHNSPLPT
ncbi:hypothetical protein [Thalassomonas actiniarum]|uniref:PEP-CTERM protein-sorting domain-containing protein n=1 Tax=Thalassomonas actiniarum TaxID=485447 RepID=A0AAE9YXH4_9GAMM|nr:hypothetical protein [Thalassomonas actiniarum]WDE02209.1 hypothetical protein SG35_031115 [Thalassomonas actiniarum]